MTYPLDPDRPPQSSGMTDVQLVEAMTAHLSRIECQVIEQPRRVREEISAALGEYTTVVDRIMEGRLRGLHADLHTTLARYQNDSRVSAALAESRIDITNADIDALEVRVAGVEARIEALPLRLDHPADLQPQLDILAAQLAAQMKTTVPTWFLVALVILLTLLIGGGLLLS